jgi:hypothetical protein
MNIELTKEQIQLIKNFLPDEGAEVPPGLDPTFYHTLTYEGDCEVQKQVNELIQILNGYNT